MRGNTWGQVLALTTFGESHGVALGAIVDGCPAGVPLTHDDFAKALARRRPGQSKITTARAELDEPEILSGVFEGKSLGAPICVIVRNHDQRSHDYDPNYLRAGHADRVWQEKYGARDWRGGGRASGRETIGRVIGGVVAERVLPDSVKIVGFTRQVGQLRLEIDPAQAISREQVDAFSTRCPDAALDAQIVADLERCKREGDSRGGVAEIWIDGLPMGLGEPVFMKAKNMLISAVTSVGAVVGATLGDAHDDAARAGLDFHTGISGQGPRAGISSAANGIQGGITNGERLRLLVYFKPASTTGSMATSGRHDPCIIPRAIPVLEAMCALTLADLYMLSKLDQR